MDLDLHYTDPRLASLYDLENAGRDDTDFYLRLATELAARSIVDLGCGTGVLACDLAAQLAEVGGAEVRGVDPAAAMLDIARHRPGSEGVTWVLGDASSLATEAADLVLMTGHVAQVFLGDAAWQDVLAQASRALVPGGHLAFETRNPDAEAWTRWTRDRTTASYRLPDGTAFSTWIDVTDAAHGLVSVEGHNVFAATAEDVVVRSTLRFRTRAEVEASLREAGFNVVSVWGDWDRSPVSLVSPELIFLARRKDRRLGPS